MGKVRGGEDGTLLDGNSRKLSSPVIIIFGVGMFLLFQWFGLGLGH